jgi:amidase
MTKSVMGAAMMMNAIATSEDATDYVAALDANSLDGKRVGVARFSQGSNPLIIERFNAGLAVLEGQGAILVDIEEAELAPEFWPNALTVLMYELKHTMDEYLASTPEAVTTRTLADVIAFNEANAEIELPYFGQDLFENAQGRGPITDQAYLDARDLVQTATRENGIDALLAEYQVDMLVSPSGVIVMEHDYTKGDVWPDEWAGAGAYAAIAGYPHITVPAGTAENVPLGFSIMSSAGRDAEVLSWGYAFEQASQLRAEPQFLKSVVVSMEVAAAADGGAEE